MVSLGIHTGHIGFQEWFSKMSSAFTLTCDIMLYIDFVQLPIIDANSFAIFLATSNTKAPHGEILS